MSRFKLFIIMSFFCLTAFAQAKFQVIPPRNVVAGQNFRVIFQLDNAQGSSLKVPEIQGCELLYGPSTSTSYSMQVINGQSVSNSSISYTYTYRAAKAGTYTIPEASINADGKTLTSNAATFRVLPADSQPSNSQGGSNSNVNVYDPTTKTSDKPISASDMFVRVIMNKSKAYEQEAVECVIKLYTKYDEISSFLPTAPPAFDGFLIDEVNITSQSNSIENYNGQNYLTAVLKKCIIFPQKTGELTITTGSYDLTVIQYETISQGYFYYKRPVERKVKLRPYTAKLNVVPLPDGAPASFSGAVGSFNMTSSHSAENTRTNEASTLTLTISGSGNIRYLKAPEIQFPVEFEQYSPNVQTDASVNGSTVTGKTTIEYTIVPQTVGTFTVPSIEFSFFNPATGKYETIVNDGYTMNVARGAAVSTSEQQQDITLKNTDILHIKRGDLNPSKHHTPVAKEIWFWSLFPILVIALIVYVNVKRRIVRRNSDTVGLKHSLAGKVARKRLSAAAKYMQLNNREQFYAEVLRALRGYISDRYSIPASELNREKILNILKEHDVEQSDVDRMSALMDECELATYSPDSSAHSLKETYDEASILMNNIQNPRKRKTTAGALTSLMLLIICSCGASASNIIQEADSAYSAQNYAEAIALYKQAMATEGTSAPLYYNLGNAYYRDGNYAQAIIAYERALKLDPTDRDTRQNLSFVNSKIVDTPADTSSYTTIIIDKALSWFTPNTWCWIGLMLFVIMLAAVAIYIFSDVIMIRKICFFGGIILFFVCGATLFVAYKGASQATAKNQGIVTAISTQLSTSPAIPLQPSQQAFLLHEGSKVEIVDSVATPLDPDIRMWYEVKVDNEHRAWIDCRDLEII